MVQNRWGFQISIRHFYYQFRERNHTANSKVIGLPTNAKGSVDLGEVVIAPFSTEWTVACH
ncbi:hypothetical protein ACVFI8_19980 [Agarivorans sp. MS3-6]|uniref:hypothetical protein n=1 Tax=Agarivorans sp. TSD2052 TaxID=2937286 RepID=UPI00200C7315|nr:hypothetical protein [Agarivorans sp. TSD2052]UPW16885.1 hypothetical protein M0C34_11570 [Agarivorans sp. TSD2052]